MIMVFLDLQEEKQMSIESFVNILIRMCQYELRDRLDVSGPAASLDGVKLLVETLHRNGYRLAILLDEFDAVTANPNFDLEFFAFLRYLANHYNVSYLTSSMRDLQTLCHTDEISDSPFFNIFSTLRLGAFRREEAVELVRVPSERAGRPLAAYTDRILDAAGLFPFFIQIACAHVLDYMDDHPDRKEPDLDEAYRRFYKEAALHYRYMWTNFPSHERSTILRLAHGKRIPESLEHVLTDLEARDVVTAEEGGPALFSRSFTEFVREEAKRDSRSSLWTRITGRG
jgi:serine/threonine-protein kinase